MPLSRGNFLMIELENIDVKRVLVTLGEIAQICASVDPRMRMVSVAILATTLIYDYFDKNKNLEEYGNAARCTGKKFEDFLSIREYIEYLDAEIEKGKVDLQKSEFDYSLGLSLAIKTIEEKYGLKTSAEFWESMGEKIDSNKMNGIELECILQMCGEKRIDTNEIVSYLSHSETKKPKSEISSLLMNALCEAHPKTNSDELIMRFNEILKK